MAKPKRENRGSGQRNPQPPKPAALNADLRKAASENCPQECYTVTYDRQSRLQTYSYRQSKEYTF
ncbi:MAG: hypothetical protein HFH93_03950 [Lachnospiraceae bacterium]|nr:hypothetical protein [Lachnospiraceae bacterium]